MTCYTSTETHQIIMAAIAANTATYTPPAFSAEPPGQGALVLGEAFGEVGWDPGRGKTAFGTIACTPRLPSTTWGEEI
jgi:hypothetical protein